MRPSLLLVLGISAALERPIDSIKHIVVIVQENWSLDGLWTGLNGVDGATDVNYVIQVDRQGTPYTTLPQPDLGNSTLDPRIPADLPNKPWTLTDYVPDNELTRDLVHRFYTHQFQINKGKLDKFVAYSDAAAYVVSHMGRANDLPMAAVAREATMATRFFQSAFGGSFLSHQWLISGRAPEWNSSVKAIPDGMKSVADLKNETLTFDGALSVDGKYAINTVYSESQPYPPWSSPAQRLPLSTHLTMGDLLSQKDISWKWYSGGWDELNNSVYDELFQYHHQAYVYYQNFAEGTEARKEHLFDEKALYEDLKHGTLPSVSWVKFYGADNEHPGYATVVEGQKHLVDCVRAIQNSSAWPNTLIILTYDEFGGRFDHVPPPQVDEFGPGSRVSTMLLSPFVKKGFIDATEFYTHDSINKFIATRFGLPFLTPRIEKAQTFEKPFNWGSAMCCEKGSLKSGVECPNEGCTDCCVTTDWLFWGLVIAAGVILVVAAGALVARRLGKKSSNSQVLLDTSNKYEPMER